MRRATIVALALVALLGALAAPPAAAALHASSTAVSFIEQREGLPNNGCPYRDPIGVWTRGFGRIEGIGPLSPCITRSVARRELRALLAAAYEPHVAALFRPGGMLADKFNQHRFDALVSFVYNLGVGAVKCVLGFESLCGAMRAASPRRVADAMLLYDKAGGLPFLGLTLRRRAERAMFLKPMGRFELFPAREVRWIREWDAGPRPARRARLRAAMLALANRIDAAARAD